MRVHHYGLATQSIDKSVSAFLSLGYEKVTEIIHDPIQGVYLLFLKNKNDHLIELVAPADEKNPVTKIINKVGNSLYHICYEVADIEEQIAILKKERFIVVVAPVEAVAFNNRKICFLYHPSIGLIELLEQ